MKESGLRENCMIRLNERTEEGEGRPPSTLHGSSHLTKQVMNRRGLTFVDQLKNLR